MDIKEAVALREAGKLKESNTLLLELVEKFPEDAMTNYQCAWSYDVLEMESEAIAYYEKAIALGLPDEDLKEAYLGLGSTYRTIGDYNQSKAVFERAMDRFDDKSLKVFYAMTLYNLGETAHSLEILLKLLAETSNDESIKSYSKAIAFYSDKLDKVF